MRNWPYAYALGRRPTEVKGKFEVAPFPEFEGGGKAGILGGHNLVISAYSKNPEGAVALIDYLTSPEAIKRDAAEYSLAPTLDGDLRGPRGQEERCPSPRAAAGGRPGEGAAGLAGVHADLLGDLQERQRRRSRAAVARRTP